MGKPNPEESTSAAIGAAPVAAVPGGVEEAGLVIRAKDGVWPEPPAGGRWVRNAKTGDLTCLDPVTQKQEPNERQARRQAQRDAALAAQAKKPKE